MSPQHLLRFLRHTAHGRLSHESFFQSSISRLTYCSSLSQHSSSSDNAAANNMVHEPETEDNSTSSSCGSDANSYQYRDAEDSDQDSVKSSDDDLEDKSAIAFAPQNQTIVVAREERRVTDTPEKHRTPQTSKEFEDGESLSEPRITHA